MDSSLITTLITGVAGLVLGTAAPKLLTYFITRAENNQKTELSLIQEQVNALQKERETLSTLQQAITSDLQKQIFALREQVLALQQENVAYARREAKLIVQLETMAVENDKLKVCIAELEHSLKNYQKNSAIIEGT